MVKTKKSLELSLKAKLISILKNKYLWMILIPDLLILYFIVRYISLIFIAFILNNPDFRIGGIIIALFIIKAIIDLIILIKIIREEV